MKTIYFVRHGQTEGNTGKLFQGPDTPLTERGLEQARIVAERCTKLPVERLLSSPAERALQTARLISDAIRLPVESSPLFTEVRRPSTLIGRSTEDAEARALQDAWLKSCLGEGPRVDDGENFEDGKRRANEALSFLEQYPADRLLVVTHGLFLRTLYARVVFGESMTPAEFKRVLVTLQSDNTSISVFTYKFRHPGNVMDGDDDVHWRMRIWNDHAHLG